MTERKEPLKDRAIIQSLDTGLQLLDLIMMSEEPLRYVDILEQTKMTKSNLYKYLATLQRANVIAKSEQTGLYYPGEKLVKYGLETVTKRDVHRIVSPYLKQLGTETGVTVLFTLATYNGPVVTKIWSPSRAINIGAQLGSILPPNSSSGKVYQCWYEDEIASTWYDGSSPLPKEECDRIRREHVAFSKEPLIESVSSFALPVLSFNEQLLGTLTTVGFSSQIPDTIDHETTQRFLRAQRQLCEQFGYVKEEE